MIEAELKCRLTPEVWDKLCARLPRMIFKGTVHNLDIYYDTPGWDLLQQAVFVRVRNKRQLEFKFNEAAQQEHVQCTERAFPLEPGAEKAESMNRLFAHFLRDWTAAPDMETITSREQLVELARIDNRRELYMDGELEVSIDHVVGLGDFFEIELRCEEVADAAHALARLRAFASDLGARHIKVGYVELWLYEYNRRAYRLGKYHLD